MDNFRCLGLTAYIKIENPLGTRIQKLFAGDEEVIPDKVNSAAYLTVQAVPAKWGKNRKTLARDAHGAMLSYLTSHRPTHAELENTIFANSTDIISAARRR